MEAFPPNDPSLFKTCKRCGYDKPLLGFYKRRGSKDGLAYWCKECMHEAQREQRRRKSEYIEEMERQLEDLNEQVLRDAGKLGPPEGSL